MIRMDVESFSKMLAETKDSYDQLEKMLAEARDRYDQCEKICTKTMQSLDTMITECEKLLEMEKEYRRKQKQGIQDALNNGVSFGRPARKKLENYEKVVKKYLTKEISSRVAARQLNVSQTTFLEWVKGEKNN